MSLSNYYEDIIGKYIVGLEASVPSLGSSRYLALLNITADNQPPYDPMNPPTSSEGMDAPAELFNTDLIDSGIELADANYERQPITFVAGGSYGQFQNSAAITFPAADAEYQVTHFAVTTSATGSGKILFWASFSLQFDMQTYQQIPLTVPAGDQLTIAQGALGVNMG